MKTAYYNAMVYTGALPLAEAFLVEGDRFVLAGTTAEVLEQMCPEDRRVDLGGCFVCAGFNDSHMHLLNYGQTLHLAPLAEHTDSLAGLIRCFQNCLAEQRGMRGGWLMGRGWNQDYFTDSDRMPNRWDLDQVSTEIPVCAIRACGHAMVLNSRAIELLGVTGHTPQPEGGQIVMERGEPNGVFLDNAMGMVFAAIPAPDKEELKGMLRSACRALNAYGVTSCQSDDYCVFRDLPWQTVNEAYQELEAAGELTVRVNEQANFTELSDLQAFVGAGNVTGTGTNRFRIGPLKLLGDGALGARTAYLSRPYADAPDTSGIPVLSQECLDEMIGYANAHGMQVAVHAIGDACLDRVLDAVERALTVNPRAGHRHGVVHCQITRPDQLDRLAKLQMHAYIQSIFLDYDIRIVEQRVGREMAGSSYNWKSLLERGVTVSNGTDCPVELPHALAGIQCAVTRSTLRSGEGPYLPQQAFTVREALDSYTSAGAYASFEERQKGKIEPGLLADFVVLGANPFTVDPSELGDIPVLATYVGGERVYRA